MNYPNADSPVTSQKVLSDDGSHSLRATWRRPAKLAGAETFPTEECYERNWIGTDYILPLPSECGMSTTTRYIVFANITPLKSIQVGVNCGDPFRTISKIDCRVM